MLPKWLIFIFFLVSIVVGMVFGSELSASQLVVLAQNLLPVSAVVFAVMGAWLAVLHPSALEDLFNKKIGDGNKKVILENLIAPLILSTFALIFSLTFPLVSQLFQVLSFSGVVVYWMKVVSLGLICFFYLLQLLALMITLWPAHYLRHESKRRESLRKQKQRKVARRNSISD